MAGIYYRKSASWRMQKHWLIGSIFAAGLMLGNVLPQHFLTPAVDAAPGDVKGSPNVAVDTYKNAEDTYILWSDGSISRASGGANINGATDYAAPPGNRAGRSYDTHGPAGPRFTERGREGHSAG